MGPATAVHVHCNVPPRVQVRTEGQAVAEHGRRQACLVMTPGQLDLMDRSPPRVFLTGPPGTGRPVKPGSSLSDFRPTPSGCRGECKACQSLKCVCRDSQDRKSSEPYSPEAKTTTTTTTTTTTHTHHHHHHHHHHQQQQQQQQQQQEHKRHP